ncbi:MAG: EamA family transporter [Nitrospinota bacterium]|nr:EamA family transporter [Nitrospinota bacterium]
MDWIALSLIAAMAQVLRNVSMKSIGHSLDEYINVLGRFFMTLPFAGIVLYLTGIPEIHPDFYIACSIFAVSQTIATLALSKALLYGKIGAVTALWKISIVWLMLLEYFTSDESPTFFGVIGILITLLGVYFLNVSRSKISFWEPLRILFRDKGMRYALISSIMFAPSALTFKWAAISSSGPMGTFGTYVAAFIFMLPISFYKSTSNFSKIPSVWKAFFALGFFAALNSLILAEAYQMTFASYVESVRQTEVLLAIFIGYIFFKEKERFWEVFVGGSIIISGLVVLILLG